MSDIINALDEFGKNAGDQALKIISPLFKGDVNAAGKAILGAGEGGEVDPKSIGANMYGAGQEAKKRAEVLMDSIGNTGLMGLPHLIQSKLLGQEDVVNQRNKLAQQYPDAKIVGDTASMLLNPASLTSKLAGTAATTIPKMIAQGAAMGAEYSTPRAFTGLLSGEKTPEEAQKEQLLGIGLGGAAPGLLSLPKALQNTRFGKALTEKFMPSPHQEPLATTVQDAAGKTWASGTLNTNKQALEEYAKSLKGMGPRGKSDALNQSIRDTLELSKANRLGNVREFSNFSDKVGRDFDMLTAQIKPGEFNIAAPVSKGKKYVPDWIDSSPEYKSLSSYHPQGKKYVDQHITDRLDELDRKFWSKGSQSKSPVEDSINELRGRIQANRDTKLTDPNKAQYQANADTDSIILKSLYNKAADIASKKTGLTFESGAKSVADLQNIYKRLGLSRFLEKNEATAIERALTNQSSSGTQLNPLMALLNVFTGQIPRFLNKGFNKMAGSTAGAVSDWASKPQNAEALNKLQKLMNDLRTQKFTGNSAMPVASAAAMTPSATANLGQIPVSEAPVQPIPQTTATAPQAPTGRVGAPATLVTGDPTGSGVDTRWQITDQSPGQQMMAPPLMSPGPLETHVNPAPGPLTRAMQAQVPAPQEAPVQQDPFDVSMFAGQDQNGYNGVFNPDGSLSRYGNFVDTTLKNNYIKYQLGASGLSYQDYFKMAIDNSNGLDPVMVANFQGAFPDDKAKEDFIKAYQRLNVLKGVDFNYIANSPSHGISSFVDGRYQTAKRNLIEAMANMDESSSSDMNKIADANKWFDDNFSSWIVGNPEKMKLLKKHLASKIGLNTSDLYRLGLDVGTPLEGVYGK